MAFVCGFFSQSCFLELGEGGDVLNDHAKQRGRCVFFDPGEDALLNASESSDNTCPWDQGEKCMSHYIFSHLDVRITG